MACAASPLGGERFDVCLRATPAPMNGGDGSDRNNLALIVDADEAAANSIVQYVRENGLDAAVARDGESAVRAARSMHPAVIVLELMLPDGNGLDVCSRLRRESDVPILILTTSQDEADRVVALELGADDYMAKPVRMRELLARLRALMRRARIARSTVSSAVLLAGDLELDPRGRTVRRNGVAIHVKPKEFDLLFALASEPGRVFTRDQLFERVWGYHFLGGSRTIDVHIRWLREKLENDYAGGPRIDTIRGTGYKFVP